MIIGITGTTCSGKHTLAQILKEFSKGEIINADTLAHELYLPGSECYDEVVEKFGKEILSENKRIDREKLGNIVFKDNKKLEELNEIIHPRIKTIMQEILTQAQKQKIYIVVAALFEKLEVMTDYIILIRADDDKKLKRAKEQREISEEMLKQMLSTQTETMDYDYLIKNDGSLSDLKNEAKTIWDEMKEFMDNYYQG